MNLSTQVADVQGKARALIAEAEAIAVKGTEATAEEKEKFVTLTNEIKGLKNHAMQLSELEQMALEVQEVARKTNTPQPIPAREFKSLGQFAKAVYAATFDGIKHPGLIVPRFTDEPDTGNKTLTNGWVEGMEAKDLVENIGASGGFLVPIQQETQLLQVPGPESVVRPRCTVVPMRRRQIRWPTLDQTNTTAGRPAWYGGVLAKWTEEAASKDETEPTFKQINLVAHKLVCYTEASDELLDDSAVGLEALLSSIYQQVIAWYEEEAFVNGTGAGQPRGVINAPATFAQARAAAGAVGIVDIINMLEHFHGSNPIWLLSRSLLPSLMQLNGPAANPSYVFMPSARDGMPGTLFGYPVFYNEHCPLIGARGDIGLYDFKMYLIGDRQGTTIDASKHFRFQNDLTAWRAVHRVDGQPWLSQPIYLQDGTTQVSPFVVLDAGTGS